MIKRVFAEETFLFLFTATWFLTQNVLCLVEGGYATTQACAAALSTVTGIPLIRLHGNSQPFERCEKTLQLSASYKAYAHASLDILSTFHWTKVALVFDGKSSSYD